MNTVSATVNGFNVGTDVSFAFTDQYGDLFSDDMLGHLIEFRSSSEDVLAKVVPISNGGVPIYQTLWSGITGSMRFARVGPTFTQLFMDLAQGYHSAGIISQFSISAKVRNRDGSVDSYLYSGVQFTKPQHGNFTSTREVDLSVGFAASTLQGTGSLANFVTGLIGAA